MKILIISHYYKHKNAMASIRAIKLAKYFNLLGHDITVLTSLQKDNWCKQEMIPIPSDNITEIYATPHRGMKYLTKVYDFLYRRGQKKSQQSAHLLNNATPNHTRKSYISNKIRSIVSWFFYYTSDRLENFFLSEGLIKSAKEKKISGFDAVIATYPGAGVHKVGEWFKRSKRTKLFIADYRDPAYNPGCRTNKIELWHDKRVQDRAVKYADAVVCVSHGMAECLAKQYVSSEAPPVFVINNGFDMDDNTNYVSANFDKTKFNFVYTGALYHGRRSVELLAPILKRLIDEGEIGIEKIAINYAGPDFNELLSQLRPFGLESIAVDFGYVSRERSLGMQQESDIVLLLNWNDSNYTGVIPGKLYEYMSARKPIVALIMGNQVGSESANMIDECKIGCACEQASLADRKKLEQYIRHKVNSFKKGIRENISSDSIDVFEYKNIARKYLDVIEQVKGSPTILSGQK